MTMTERRQSRNLAGGIAIAILAVIAVSYFESLAIDRAPAFAAACNLARSTDLKPVLDAGSEDSKVGTPAAY